MEQLKTALLKHPVGTVSWNSSVETGFVGTALLKQPHWNSFVETRSVVSQSTTEITA
jgi:hypothetical protein